MPVAGVPASTASPTSNAGFRLDEARIARLQEETAQASALLSGVFAVDAAGDAEPQEVESEAETEAAEGLPLGLDPDHAAFLRLLISRASWPRA
ncbi:tellurite resistance TerB C-terminal domain-containing protein, partial [Acinetobacter baumannii]